MQDDLSCQHRRTPLLRAKLEPQRKHHSVTVVAAQNGIIRFHRCGKNCQPQQLSVCKCDSERRLEDPRLVTAVTMQRIEDVFLKFDAEVSPLSIWKLHCGQKNATAR